ncbi:unnamed protein product, partial [Symbiodinium natans]
ATLGVQCSCSDEEVKQAYRALALKTLDCSDRKTLYEGRLLPMFTVCWMLPGGDLALARSLLADAADVQAQDSTGRSAILFAASAASVQVLRLLLAHAADVMSCNCAGHTCVGALVLCRLSLIGAWVVCRFDGPHGKPCALSEEDSSKAAQRLDAVRLLLDEGRLAAAFQFQRAMNLTDYSPPRCYCQWGNRIRPFRADASCGFRRVGMES